MTLNDSVVTDNHAVASRPNGRHADSDVDSAPCMTGKMHAIAVTRMAIETMARLDSRLSKKTRFGLALMRRSWNGTRLTSNPNAIRRI